MLPVHSVVSLVLVLCISLFVLLVTLVLNVLVVSVVLVLVVPVPVDPVPTVTVLLVKPVRLRVVFSVECSISVFDAEVVAFNVSSDDLFCCEFMVLLLAITVEALKKLPTDVDSDEDGTVEVCEEWDVVSDVIVVVDVPVSEVVLEPVSELVPGPVSKLVLEPVSELALKPVELE